MDDNVLPIVEELQRRLPLTSASSKGQLAEEDENPGGARDEAEAGEEHGNEN